MQKSLSERDGQVIWHPYTQHKGLAAPIPIDRADGALLFDFDGNAYIDAISSWWVTLHGHANPYIAKKIFEQASRLEQVIFTGFTHAPAVELAERLLKILPAGQSKLFFSDNGSTAVEVALKMGIQYWKNSPSPTSRKRTKILAFANAYHGDTFGAMSVSGRSVFTDAFRDYLFEVIVIDTPNASNIESLKNTIAIHAPETACFIYEPLLQAAGGMLMYEPAWMDLLLAEIKKHEILTIADEVLTGFGRTGTYFASAQLAQTPDIICLSKGITGGAMALGATACVQKIYDAFLSDDRTHTLFHGHSYTANPIACAAALASLDLLEKKACTDQIQALTKANRKFIDEMDSVRIKNKRALGTVLAFELASGIDGYLNPHGSLIQQQAMEAGIYLRPLGNTVYIMPPYGITEEQLARVYHFLDTIVIR